MVKPLDFIARGAKGLRAAGGEVPRARVSAHHLRAGLHRAGESGAADASAAWARKRALALREFALGVESLERFVAREPLWRMHQAVFGVLALESEPVDPRL